MLEIVFDDEQTAHPSGWNWHDLLDMGSNEQVTIVMEESFSVNPDLVKELEEK